MEVIRLYGEDVEVMIRSEVLLSRRLGGIPLQYVFVVHPTRGKMILLSTDLKIKPVDVVRMYSYRFKIEVAFKSAVHSLGAFLYRFWMKRHGKDTSQARHKISPQKNRGLQDKVFHKTSGI